MSELDEAKVLWADVRFEPDETFKSVMDRLLISARKKKRMREAEELVWKHHPIRIYKCHAKAYYSGNEDTLSFAAHKCAFDFMLEKMHIGCISDFDILP